KRGFLAGLVAQAPGKSLREVEGLHVGESALLVFLQDDATAARHLRQFAGGKDDHLAILAHDGDMIALDRRAHRGLDALGEVQHLLAGARLRHDLTLRHDEAPAVIGGDDQLVAGPLDEQRDDVLVVAEVDHQADRFAVAATARQLVGAEGIEATVGAEYQQLVGSLGVQEEPRAVALLVLDLVALLHVTLEGTDPALVRADDGHGLALDHGLAGNDDSRWRIAQLGAPLAQRRLRAEALLEIGNLRRDSLPLPLLVLEQTLEVFLLGGELLALLLDLDLLKAAQGAQSHVQDGIRLEIAELPSLHH